MFSRPLNDSHWVDDSLYLYGQRIYATYGDKGNQVTESLRNTVWFSYRKDFGILTNRLGKEFRTDTGRLTRLGVCGTRRTNVFL